MSAAVAEIEWRRSRLEVEAIVTSANAKVDEARLTAESRNRCVRAEVAQYEAAIATKDREIGQLVTTLADRDQVPVERATAVDRLTPRIEQELAGRAKGDRRSSNSRTRCRPSGARSPRRRRPLQICNPSGRCPSAGSRASGSAPRGRKPTPTGYARSAS
jgi:hypothetical protein